jgi:hypothetical protein
MTVVATMSGRTASKTGWRRVPCVSDFHVADLDDHVRFDVGNGCLRREVTEWRGWLSDPHQNSSICSAFERGSAMPTCPR